MSRKPTGTLLLADLAPGKRLYLLCTGTGAAPFLSIIQDPELYARFDRGDLRPRRALGARDRSGPATDRRAAKARAARRAACAHALRYYPTVTPRAARQPRPPHGAARVRPSAAGLRLPPLDPAVDRLMVCGSPALLTDLGALLDARGFTISPRTGEPGDYVIERAFVTRPPASQGYPPWGSWPRRLPQCWSGLCCGSSCWGCDFSPAHVPVAHAPAADVAAERAPADRRRAARPGCGRSGGGSSLRRGRGCRRLRRSRPRLRGGGAACASRRGGSAPGAVPRSMRHRRGS